MALTAQEAGRCLEVTSQRAESVSGYSQYSEMLTTNADAATTMFGLPAQQLLERAQRGAGNLEQLATRHVSIAAQQRCGGSFDSRRLVLVLALDAITQKQRRESSSPQSTTASRVEQNLQKSRNCAGTVERDVLFRQGRLEHKLRQLRQFETSRVNNMHAIASAVAEISPSSAHSSRTVPSSAHGTLGLVPPLHAGGTTGCEQLQVRAGLYTERERAVAKSLAAETMFWKWVDEEFAAEMKEMVEEEEVEGGGASSSSSSTSLMWQDLDRQLAAATTPMLATLEEVVSGLFSIGAIRSTDLSVICSKTADDLVASGVGVGASLAKKDQSTTTPSLYKHTASRALLQNYPSTSTRSVSNALDKLRRGNLTTFKSAAQAADAHCPFDINIESLI